MYNFDKELHRLKHPYTHTEKKLTLIISANFFFLFWFWIFTAVFATFEYPSDEAQWHLTSTYIQFKFKHFSKRKKSDNKTILRCNLFWRCRLRMYQEAEKCNISKRGCLKKFEGSLFSTKETKDLLAIKNVKNSLRCFSSLLSVYLSIYQTYKHSQTNTQCHPPWRWRWVRGGRDWTRLRAGSCSRCRAATTRKKSLHDFFLWYSLILAGL